jgi:hypothetical protein
MTPERKVKNLVRDLLKVYGAWQYWPVSNGMGVHGIPDCIACYNGFFISIETKAPGKKPTALQVMQGTKITEAGGVWLVIDGEAGLAQLKEVLDGKASLLP